MSNKMINKKGQIATTATWLFATLIIFFLLAVFFFVTKGLSGVKKLDAHNTAFGIDIKTSDIITVKSFSAYLLSKQDAGGGNIYDKIVSSNNLDNFNGNLAQEIFWFLYPIRYLLLTDRPAVGIFIGYPGEDKDVLLDNVFYIDYIGENKYVLLDNAFFKGKYINLIELSGFGISDTGHIKVYYYLSNEKKSSIIFKGVLSQITD